MKENAKIAEKSLLFIFIMSVPVSYTHLDVYKRQGVWKQMNVLVCTYKLMLM